MHPVWKNQLLWIGLTATFIFGSSFLADILEAFSGDDTIWWTHQEMKLPLEQTKNHFELYINGKLLQQHLSDKTLITADSSGRNSLVTPKDIAARLNNRDAVKSSILSRAIVSGFASGVAVTVLITGLMQALRHTRRDP